MNAVIYRLYKDKKLSGFSECPNCRHRLYPKDLIPVISFFWLGGKCRYCRKKISWQYPVVELVTALVFAVTAKQTFLMSYGIIGWQNFIFLGFLLAIFSTVVVIFVFDLRYYLIPDIMVVIGFFTALLMRIVLPGQSLKDGLFGALLLLGFFGALFVFSRGTWIGLGDVKLGLFLGMALGFSMSVLMLGIAYVSGAIVGVAMILMHRKTLKETLPFGTFLTASTVVTMIWGQPIFDWYLSFF